MSGRASPDDDVDLSSPESSPQKLAPVQFHPKFSVTVPDATKNGDVLQFTIKVYKHDNASLVTEINREYGDVLWLHHNLITQNNIDGIIVPPLPVRPEVDAKAAESKSKKQLGKDCHVVVPDEFNKDCRQMQKYLSMMLSHDSFGKDVNLHKFLTEKEAPTRTKVVQGFLSKMSSAVESARKEHHRDIDDYFTKKRDWCTNYSKAIKETSANFSKMTNAQQRLGTSYGSLATELQLGTTERDEATLTIQKSFNKLSEATDNSKRGWEVLAKNDETTLGYQLELYSRYIDSVKDMLFKRTCILVDYEDANKALDKAKPAKRQAAEDAKLAAETRYEMCCDNARREFKTFLQTRMLAYQEGMTAFADSQIKTARDTYTLLAKTMTVLKQLNNS